MKSTFLNFILHNSLCVALSEVLIIDGSDCKWEDELDDWDGVKGKRGSVGCFQANRKDQMIKSILSRGFNCRKRQIDVKHNSGSLLR